LGEIARLRVRDVDFVRSRLVVQNTMVGVDGYMQESSPRTTRSVRSLSGSLSTVPALR